MREDGIEVGVDAAWDRPLDEGIVRKAAAAGCDLVVKDTHYHSVLKRAFFSNTDWNLIRDCPQPLLLVKPHPRPQPLRIAAAVDPLHGNDKPAALDHRIVETANELAQAAGAELHVLHCFDDRALSAMMLPSPAVPLSPPLIDAAAVAEIETTHRTAVAGLLTDLGLDPALATVGRGSPADWLPATAEALGIGMLVTGAVSRSALERVLVGSTAEQVLDRLPCDLLVVKPAGFVTPVAAQVADG
jgi:universal stress protein E